MTPNQRDPQPTRGPKNEVRVEFGSGNTDISYNFKEWGKGPYGEKKIVGIYMVSVNYPIVKKGVWTNGILWKNGKARTDEDFIIKYKLVDKINGTGNLFFNKFSKDLGIWICEV